jgi:hypothetical protein
MMDDLQYAMWRLEYYIDAKTLTYRQIDRGVKQGKIIPGERYVETCAEKQWMEVSHD